MNRYVIGIDTGGTFTDGVLMHYRSRRVVKSAKTLTTRHDLKEGVINVIDELDIQDTANVRLVGISSTLATNSIAEGKARKVGLLLIGYDRDLIEGYGLGDKLSTEVVEYVAGGHTSQGAEKAELDIDAVRTWIDRTREDVDAYAVSSYFSPLNPEHEERAFAVIRECTDLPVVMGHQLSTKLDSIKRAATASLNASLVAVMQEFIQAVRHSLKEHGIRAPLMIVRGDGTLMPYTEAIQKPVETVLSGPAASASGGRFLSQNRDSLVIDMGSTTTDMALVDEGHVVVSERGARVGDTETAVEAAHIRTLCIGCDSRISIDRDRVVTVGPERIMAISQLADRYPQVAAEIANLRNRPAAMWKATDVEYWFLYNHPDPETLNDGEAKLVELLRDGPANVTTLLESLGVFHPSQLPGDELFRRGELEAAALTPTDLLHVTGNMDLWDEDTARMAVRVLAKVHEKNREHFVEGTLDGMVRKIVEEIIIFLACQEMKRGEMPYQIDGEWGRWLFEEMVDGRSRFLSVNIDSRYPLLGTGAPAEYFIKRAAEMLSAPFIMPKHYDVANAVGAVSGSVMESKQALLFTRKTADTVTHVVQIDEETKTFQEWEDACDYAEETVEERAREALLNAGATAPHIDLNRRQDGAVLRILARAVGNPKLSGAVENEDAEETDPAARTNSNIFANETRTTSA